MRKSKIRDDEQSVSACIKIIALLVLVTRREGERRMKSTEEGAER